MKFSKINKSKLITLIFSFVMSLALMLGIVLLCKREVYAETTTIDTLEVAFKKASIGDSLATAIEFEDEEAKTLKVPSGANYKATLLAIFRDGQKQTLWSMNNTSFPWSRVENQLIEQKIAYDFRVRFEPNTGYTITSDADIIKRNIKVSGAELGKGKDVEFLDTAGQNRTTTAVDIDFIITRGMTYIGNQQSIYPKIGVEVTGTIGTLYTDTGIWLRGAPGPYSYEAKIAPIGMEIQSSNVFEESNCYYRIKAVNSMDEGTMYITVTASDGQTCDIPVQIKAVSGGHEHTWSDFGKIDFEHHGYRKCSASDCPGIALTFDKGSQYSNHEFYDGCNAKCKTCGDLNNPDATHNYIATPDENDNTCHVYKCNCGEVEKDSNGNVKKEKHNGGTQTCLNGAQCDVCGVEYLAATGHKYEFKSFGNNDGTYTHLGFCKYCKIENTKLRHSPIGGEATCQERAICTYKDPNGDECGCVYGNLKNHNFVDGICTECKSDKYIKDIIIDVPEFYKGMIFKSMFYPGIIKGSIVDMGIYYHKGSPSRDGNVNSWGYYNFETERIKENFVMYYVFEPQTNCEFLENIGEMKITLTRGELLKQEIRESDGRLVVLVLLRIDSVVQSVDIDFSQPIADSTVDRLNIVEKNGYEFTIDSIGPLDNNKIIYNTPLEIALTIKAPQGMLFQSREAMVSYENWLCDIKIPEGSRIVIQTLNADLTELKLTIQTQRAIECMHETVTLKEEERMPTCTEDGIKNKYACEDCGKEFLDDAHTIPWNDKSAIIPKGHMCKYYEEKPCSDGKDGKIAYYQCQREDCRKLFADAAYSKEIKEEETIMHDFKMKWSADKDNHYHECKNCDMKKDIVAHRPDRVGATEDYAVKCLDCGHVIARALGHTIHNTMLIPEVEATCMKEGTKSYYKCEGCEEKFEDELATKPITDDSKLIIPKAHRFGIWVAEVPATEEMEGVKGHKDCDFCKKHFDENGIEIADITIKKLVKVEVNVVGGDGGGRMTIGETITIRADKPVKGKVFRGWRDGSGNIVSTDAEYTFTVTENTLLTAVYEDAPETEKEGLTGGAIAGIIIGSLVGTGIIGFAIFWFVFKKKKFADLIAAIKVVINKKE